ncbi:MAG TPA: winged helix-turn-helix domain-containing protein, partial [Phenylobacterium sp.]
MRRTGSRDVVFDEDYLTALRADGVVVRFTRHERALLGLLAPNPGRLFTRGELFAALDSRGSDRNVDFVVNRLRGKLLDTGSERRFISTQYGEGYVWVAAPTDAAAEGEFIVIGPLRGLRDERVEPMLAAFQAAVQDRMAKDLRVRLFPDLSGGKAGDHPFSIEVCLYPAAGRLHAAFVMRHGPSGDVIASFREAFADAPAEPEIDALADAVVEAAWKRLTLGSDAAPAPADPPLHVRLEAASVLLDPPGETWAANGEQIARLRTKDPDNPSLAVLWAMHLLGRLTVNPGPEPLCREVVDPLSDEIERLVLAHLSAVRDDPVMAIAAAKLLLGVHRDHEDLAEELAKAAFDGSTAFAATLSMLAQIKASRGELAEARRLYDESLQLCDPGSTFEVYILVLKAQALIAGDDRPGVEAAYQRLSEITPAALQRFGLFFLPAGDDGLARTLMPLVGRAREGQARRVLA